MKMMLLVTITTLLLLSCREFSDRVKTSIPGTYMASWKTTFSVAVDTLTITVSSTGGDAYFIVRRTHLQFINAAKNREPEYAISKWQGYYRPTDKTIIVQVNGRILSFNPESKSLRMGNLVYRKL